MKDFDFVLPELQYKKTELEPFMSERTLTFHREVHHKSYIDKALGLLKATSDTRINQLDIDETNLAVWNNVAQHHNHSVFWKSISPAGGHKRAVSACSRELLELLTEQYGANPLDGTMKDAFIKAGLGQFGSGWVWLTHKQGAFHILKTSNAGVPSSDHKLLFVCDVWEHAYYLDYQAARAKYLENFWDYMVDWSYVLRNLTAS